ncbi:MoaC-domain-containing protein [Melanomma pulvis-pyrius CBS 109.77]|uniref:cyclic pyranopterin monophosphate synthase n=1 Tax=Melanomma pulvis-pyrius CBS 109.77 TaxID=1314802 RepID=A0A6A6XTF9_9PLEO|nr:MoaC-domain-containing protein [Melanomma pulvis-pyrius CBS 109.77]
MDEFDAELGWLRDVDVDGEFGGQFLESNLDEEDEQPGQSSLPKREADERGVSTDSLFGWKSTPDSRIHQARSFNFRSFSTSARQYSSKSNPTTEQSTPTRQSTPTPTPAPSLPHLTASGSAHMVSVSEKPHTTRTALAAGTVYFSNATPLRLIRANALKKGDVLSVSRIAGIMAAKRTPDLIPLCHPIALTHAGVELALFDAPPPPISGTGEGGAAQQRQQQQGAESGSGFGGVHIEARVECTGATGVEMEALTAVAAAALTVVDMCKAVDKGMRISDVRVVLKEGGRSGVWREEGWRSRAL